jgi:hypothetical protein
LSAAERAHVDRVDALARYRLCSSPRLRPAARRERSVLDRDVATGGIPVGLAVTQQDHVGSGFLALARLAPRLGARLEVSILHV